MPLHEPMKALIKERLEAVIAAGAAADLNTAIFSLLDVFDGIGRNVAQVSWTLHYEAKHRDDLMKDDEDLLVFQALQIPLSTIYPELPAQVEGVIRDAFDDEHYRLEDPAAWERDHAP